MNAEVLAERFRRYGAGATLPDCILWTSTLTRQGYPVLYGSTGITVYAHRWVWEQANGPLGDLTIDHLCHVRCCINLAHLEAVPQSVNSDRMHARKDRCIRGHEYDMVTKEGHRACRTCRRDADLTRRRRLWPERVPRTELNHCRNGHPYTADNLVTRSDSPARRCRACLKATCQRRDARVKLKRQEARRAASA